MFIEIFSSFQALKLKVVASSFGKCTRKILKDWYESVFCAQIIAESIILLDAFGGFNTATTNENGKSGRATGESTNASAMDSSGEESEDSRVEVAEGWFAYVDIYVLISNSRQR